jgi:hypothetical protein
MPTAKPAPVFFLITSAPEPLVRVNSSSARRLTSRGLLQRQAADRGARPDRHHAVAVLAEDQGVDLRRRDVQFLRDQAAEANRVELRPQADHLAFGQIKRSAAT